MTNYEEYIKGKFVALVGPANYLTHLELGKKIDSHDIVVRINRGMEVIDSYPKSLGTRTDVLYNCLIDSPDNGGEIDVDFYRSRGVKWVSTIPGSKATGECENSDLHHMVRKSNIKLIKDNFNFHVMNYKDYAKLNKEIECRANTGFSAIFDLLNCGAERVYVCGFSFYLDNFIDGYKKGCSRDEEEFAKQCFVSKRHNQKNQWAYLKCASRFNERIECDEVLWKILQMKELERDEFDISNIYPN